MYHPKQNKSKTEDKVDGCCEQRRETSGTGKKDGGRQKTTEEPSMTIAATPDEGKKMKKIYCQEKKMGKTKDKVFG